MLGPIGNYLGTPFGTCGSNNSFKELKKLITTAPANMKDVTISTGKGLKNVTYQQYLELSKQVIDQAPTCIALINLDKEGNFGLTPNDFETVIDIAIKKSGQIQKEELINHIKYSGHRYTPEDKDRLVKYIDTCLQRPTHQSVSSGIASYEDDDSLSSTCCVCVDILYLGLRCIDLIPKNS